MKEHKYDKIRILSILLNSYNQEKSHGLVKFYIQRLFEECFKVADLNVE